MTASGEIRAGGRTALVLGGSGGIGSAVALRLGQMGYRLALAARDLARLQKERGRLAAIGPDLEVECYACDIADEAAVEHLVAAVMGQYGRIDVLVNAAGTGRRDVVARARAEAWQETMRVNALGVALVCKHVLRAMAKNGEGHIVNVGSVVGRRGRGGLASYGASKAAMMAMTDSLREEAQRSGIKVSLVSPDRVATAMQEGAASGRMLPPSDVAEAVAFLLRLSPSGVVHELTLHVMGD